MWFCCQILYSHLKHEKYSSTDYSKSPIYKWIPFWEHVRSPTLFIKSNKASLGIQPTQLAIQYCNNTVKQIIHKTQTQKIKKTFLILQYSTLRSTVVLLRSTSYVTAVFSLLPTSCLWRAKQDSFWPRWGLVRTWPYLSAKPQRILGAQESTARLGGSWVAPKLCWRESKVHPPLRNV